MACQHRSSVLARKRFGPFESYARQCVRCGRRVGANLNARKLTDDEKAGARLWNPRLRRQGGATARTRRYRVYLQSTEWKRLRERILERDGFTCQRCGEEATDCGHLTYDRFGEERLGDLEALCRDCNLAEKETRWMPRSGRD